MNFFLLILVTGPLLVLGSTLIEFRYIQFLNRLGFKRTDIINEETVRTAYIKLVSGYEPGKVPKMSDQDFLYVTENYYLIMEVLRKTKETTIAVATSEIPGHVDSMSTRPIHRSLLPKTSTTATYAANGNESASSPFSYIPMVASPFTQMENGNREAIQTTLSTQNPTQAQIRTSPH